MQGKSVAGSTGTSQNLVLSAAPTTGNTVTVEACPSVAVTSLTVKDSNNNSYTVTTNSPSTVQSGAGQCWSAYLLSAPANASATITASWTTTATTPMFADEFSCSGCTIAFDKDAKANSSVAGTTINTPSITPTNSSELLYAGAAAGGTISAVGSPWTQNADIVRNGDWAEYDLSATGATSVNFTQSSGTWSAMAMAFTVTASGGCTQPPTMTTLHIGNCKG